MVAVGAYFDLRTPPGHDHARTQRTYSFSLELCEEAERVGLESLWFSEHHLFDDGYLPQPLVYAAAAAARTRRVRIGTAVVIAPIRNALHIAEEAAVVDLISEGRLELGLGGGYRVPEYELFVSDITTRFRTVVDRAREVDKLLKVGPITPRPNGEIPLWLGFGGPRGARLAGLEGMGLLSADPALAPEYLAGLVKGGHDPAMARMAGHLTGYITEDPDRDWPLVSESVRYQIDSYNRHAVQGTDAPTPRPADPDKFRERGLGTRLTNLLYTTPEDAAAQLRVFTADTPIKTVFFFVSIGGMPEAMVVQHIQALGRLSELLRGSSE